MAKFYRFQFAGRFDDGVTWITGLHYHVVEPLLGSDPAPADVLDGIDGHLRTAFKALMHNTNTLDSAELREEVTPFSSEVPSAASKVINETGTFSGGTQGLPDAMDAIVKLRSNAALRSGRGYMAIPCPRSTGFLSTSRVWTGTFWTNLQAFAALLDDVLSMGSGDPSHAYPIVYSRTRRGLQKDPFHFDVVEAIPRAEPSWRKSRERG